MGLGPQAGIGGEQVGQVELIDRLVDGAGEMIGGQVVVDRPPFGGPMIPRGYGEAIEVRVVPRRDRADRREEVDRAVRRIRPPMALRSRWEYHDARAPFVEGAGFASAILR